MSKNDAPGRGEVFPTQRSNREIHTTETVFNLEGESFKFATYNIGVVREQSTPGIMKTGREQDVLERHKDNPLLLSKHTKENYTRIPYTWLDGVDGRIYGDYSTPAGQNELADSDLVVSEEPYNPPEWAAELQRFAELKQACIFELDEIVACVRGVETRGDHLRFTVGPGLYSEGWHSMGSEGVLLSLTDEERRKLSERVSSEHMAELDELMGKLQRQYSAGSSLRDIILQRTGGVLPSFNDQVYSSILGVAGTVLTRDGDYVFVRRGKNVSVNLGINVTTSGAAAFDQDALARYGLPIHLGNELHREAEEEVGLKSGVLLSGAMQRRIKLELGVENNDYELVQVGFARELLRGGSPEAMFLIRYKGSTEDLVNMVANKKNTLTGEVDEFMYAMPAARAAELIKRQGASSIIQHKGVLNLIMMDQYLKNHG